MFFEEELSLLLKSRHLFIYIVTNEEERIECLIREMIATCKFDSIYYWDFIDGYQGNPNYIGKAKRNPIEALEFIESFNSDTHNVFVLRDFDAFLEDLSIMRKIKNLSRQLKHCPFNIIILAQEVNIPNVLNETITILEFPLPDIQEIKMELYHLIRLLDVNFDQRFILDLAYAYKGLTIERIRKSICKFISGDHTKNEILNIILQEKKQIIKQTQILDFYPSNQGLADIGGLHNLKNWLKKRSQSFSRRASNYGLPSPKGIFLVGVQGTGKSLSAKAIANEWKLPLLRLDVGRIFAGLVGESESRVRMMIRVSEALAPCILWIDEIDKAFSQNNTDSGTTKRVFATFLTWLSEKNTQVFVVATANNTIDLPVEFFRKGRFDEIFFLNLPSLQERFSIFMVHLKKVRPLTWHTYDIYHLGCITENFSGAEIEQLIIEAMHNAFAEKREFSTEDIINASKDFIPLAFTDSVAIKLLQEWASLGKVRLAS